MVKKYSGSLSLEWFNKNRALITQPTNNVQNNDIPAPKINWINKDEALFYEISEEEGKGLTPYWVDRNDIRVKESRPLVFQKSYKAVLKNEKFNLVESNSDDVTIENILIRGDNLLALNTLKKMFNQRPDSERIKCIFIDPPYNTGSAFIQYDDNLAHSEWLSIMRDRLEILKDLLRNDGSIWITIDSRECHYLKVLCDEVFGRDNFISEVIWQKRTTRENRAAIGSAHDSILVYAKTSASIWKHYRNLLPGSGKGYSNPDNDPRGPWRSIPFSAQGFRSNQMYKIKTPTGRLLDPPKGRCWGAIESVYRNLVEEKRVYFPKEGNGRPRIKQFPEEEKGLVPMSLWQVKDVDSSRHGFDEAISLELKEESYSAEKQVVLVPMSIWLGKKVGTTEDSKKEILELFKDKEPFDTPKPEKLISQIITIATEQDDYVLDCFGGSGTTFAVAHKCRRRWIGVEIGSHCDSYIIPRLNKVLEGVDEGGVTGVQEWVGGGSYKYYHLGESIILIDGDGHCDFNWSLGKDHLEQSLLASYDFIVDSTIEIPPSIVSSVPKIGFYELNNVSMAGVVSLALPDEPTIPIFNDEVNSLISAIRKHKSPLTITIFTNRGVEMAYESKPDDVEIIKVPHAIFAELER